MIIIYVNKWKKIVNNNQKRNWKKKKMNVDQDIQQYKMRYSPDCVYWIWLFKSIKDKSTS